MASGKRGKLREQLEGIHKNCEWIRQHCDKSLSLINVGHPEIINSLNALRQLIDFVDESAQKIYSHV